MCVGGHESGTTLSLRSWSWLHNWATEHTYVSVCVSGTTLCAYVCVWDHLVYVCMCVCVSGDPAASCEEYGQLLGPVCSGILEKCI